MKMKDVLSLFDSSVRKLKKIYGTEAMNVRVTKIGRIEQNKLGLETCLALCEPLTDYYSLELYGRLTIFPFTYLKQCGIYTLDEETARFCVMATACHEMAHWLHFYREVKRIRNEYVHDKKVGRIAIKLFFQEVSYHGEDWQRIMTEEMGSTDVDEYWTPSYKMPKIFVR